MGENTHREIKPAIFYGWFIVAASLITIVIAYSSRYAFSVFYVAILDEFGWSHAATSAAMTINLLIYTLCCPLAGILVDMLGARKIIPFGGMLLGIALIGCRHINSMWQLYLLFGLTGVGTATIGIVPNIAILSNWFRIRRGLVMGISFSGFGLAMILTPYAQYLISNFGWRNTYLFFAALAIVLVVPIDIIFLRNKPEDKGLVPDGIAELGEAITRGKHDTPIVIDKEWAAKDWTLARSAQTHEFWGLILLNVLTGMYSYTLITHQVVYLVKDVGYSEMFGAAVFGWFGISLAVGGIIGGLVSDRKGREITFTFSSVGSILGVLCLLHISDTLQPWLPFLYATVFGVSNGATSAILAPIAADFFAGKHFGAINGIMTMALIGGGAFGPLIAGILRDMTGSFSIVFVSILFAISVAAFLLWLVAPRKVRVIAQGT